MNSRFDSRLLHLFVLSLQSKETQKVHQHFRAVPASESKKSGSEAANRPHRSPIYPYLARFYPKMQEKTPFAVVDKRGFFDGRGGGIRTHAYSSQSAVSYRLTTPQRFNLKKNRKIIRLCEKSGVGSRGRTDDLQGHNLAL